MKSIIKAFTLAETLITLVIIGVVAAVTIPALHQNMQEEQYKIKAKKAYSVIAAAVQKMKMDEGGSLSDFYGNTASFKPVFMKYFKVIKDCGNANCVPSADESDIYTTLNGGVATTATGAEGQFITTDGFFFNIQNTTSGPNVIAIIVDVNGYKNKPNQYGVDTFSFQLLNDNVVPSGSPGTFSSYSLCSRTVSESHQGLGCTAKVMSGEDY